MILEPGAVVLLGAGASAEANVPMSFEMTRRIAERISNTTQNSREAAALNFVCATLIADNAARGSASRDLDVEHVFAAVQLLAERRSLEVAPFVSSWHPAVDALDQSNVAASSFNRDLREALLGNPLMPMAPSGSPFALISRLIETLTSRGAAGSTYTNLAALMLDELRQLVATTAKDVDYLQPIVTRGNLHLGLTVASLNYDRSIERAGEVFRVPVATGIEDWIATGQWDWPPQGIRLLKLHGSIDWVWKTQAREGHLPRDVVVVSEDPGDHRPALIFGQRAKLRAEGPFLSLLAEFENQLAKARRLVVIGYSFRDDHVNEIVRRWTAEDAGRNILVVDPVWPDLFATANTDFRAQLESHLVPWTSRQPPRPSPHVEPPFEPRLEVWKKTCSQALPELV